MCAGIHTYTGSYISQGLWDAMFPQNRGGRQRIRKRTVERERGRRTELEGAEKEERARQRMVGDASFFWT